MKLWEGGRQAALILAIVVVVASKIAVAAWVAPHPLGDSSDMIAAAELILEGTLWSAKVDPAASELLATTWRPVGYPVVIAATKFLFGTAWVHGILAVQSLMSLGAGLAVASLCRVAGLSWGLTALVFLLHQWSTPLSTDTLVLGDSLNGSLGTLAAVVVLKAVTAGRRPTLAAYLGAGVLLALAALLRDGLYIVVSILAVLVFALTARKGGLIAALLAALAFAGPATAAAGATMAWNQYRVGAAVTSTSAHTVYPFAILRMARFDPSILAGDGPVETALRTTNETWDYVDSRRANQWMYRNLHMTALDQIAAAKALFWRTVAHHPVAFFRNALDNLRPVQQGTLFAGPLTRVDDIRWWSGQISSNDEVDGWRAQARAALRSGSLSALSPTALALLVANGLTRMVGLAVFALFTFGTPLLWWRWRQRDAGSADSAALAWGTYWLLVLLCLPANLEVRYLSPVIGGALFATAMMFAHRRDILATFGRRDR